MTYLEDFAMRVERLCDFFISKAERDGSADIRTLQDLKEEAADIQAGKLSLVSEAIDGLSDYMKGVKVP